MSTERKKAPRVDVVVDQETIEASTKRDSSHCMIAEAVKAAYPNAQRVAVDIQTIRFSDPKLGMRFTYLTPRTAQVKIIQFDQGVVPEPFSIQLRNGQVTNSGSAQKRANKEQTEAQRLQRSEAGRRGGAARHRNRAVLVSSPSDERSGSVPSISGGRTPPTTPFARRRAFGLRGLEH